MICINLNSHSLHDALPIYQEIIVYGDLTEATKDCNGDGEKVFAITEVKDAKEDEDSRFDFYIFSGSCEGRGAEAIKALEEKGGVNRRNYSGEECGEALYYIIPGTRAIDYANNDDYISTIKRGRQEIILPERICFVEGDVVVDGDGDILRIGHPSYLCMNDKEAYEISTDYTMTDWSKFRKANDGEREMFHKVVELGVKNLCKPQQYDKVLVRDYDAEEWAQAMFVDMRGDFYNCLDYIDIVLWNTIEGEMGQSFYIERLQCVLEAGNEHLLKTQEPSN